MGWQTRVAWVAVAAAFPMLAIRAVAEETPMLNVAWRDGSQAIRLTFRGTETEYPARMTEGEFPAAGSPLAIDIQQQWPIVTAKARWALPLETWPEPYRADALDLVLLLACDVDLYDQLYPQAVIASRVLSLPERLAGAPPPTLHGLAQRLRGQTIDYEIKARAGAGAADYTVTTGIRVGCSRDGKTAFYYDGPGHISEHLKTREYVFAVRHAGDRIQCELLVQCVCAPRTLLRPTAMGRVADCTSYLVEQMQAVMTRPRTTEDIKKYLQSVKARYRPDKTEEKERSADSPAGAQAPPHAKEAGK